MYKQDEYITLEQYIVLFLPLVLVVSIIPVNLLQIILFYCCYGNKNIKNYLFYTKQLTST